MGVEVSDVAVVGTGIIGSTLTRAWRSAQRDVVIGARDPKRRELQELAGETGAHIDGLAAAVARAPVIVLAIPGPAVPDLAATFGAALEGKIVIDASNDVGGATLNGFAAITAAARTVHYFRAFNTVGWENFANPRYGSTVADLFYTGPSGVPQDVVERLIDDVGLRPVYVGDNDQIAIVDGLTKLWFALAFNQGRGRGIAFKLLER